MGTQDITNRFNGINSWIENNMNTDPNLYEMVDCLVDYGTLAATNSANDMNEAKNALGRMFWLRGSHPAFKDQLISSYISGIMTVTTSGKYSIPSDSAIERIKREVLTKTAGIYFYIWQTKQREPEYQYDNVVEFKGLKDAYEVYKGYAGVEEIDDANNYSGPQFGQIIENMIAGIDANYKYRDANNINKQI